MQSVNDAQAPDRSHRHTLTLSDEEKRIIERAARSLGLSANAWMRLVLLPAARQQVALVGGAR